MSNPIKHIFHDVNMANQHEGLAQIALEEKIDISRLRLGDMVIFLNSPKDRVKILAGTGEEGSRGLIAYYRSPKGKFDMNAIAHIPTFFNGGAIDFTKAIRKSLLEKGIKEIK